MSAMTHVPKAKTEPTDSREGQQIDPHRVECPYCPREGVVEDTVLLCHGCGRWFEVVTTDDEAARPDPTPELARVRERELVDRLVDLGCTDEQIDRFREAAPSVHAIFAALDRHGDITCPDLRGELDQYSSSTVSRGTRYLANEVGVVETRRNPMNAREVIYSVVEAGSGGGT